MTTYASRPQRILTRRFLRSSAALAVALLTLPVWATVASATCDAAFTTRIGPPAMAQPDGTIQTVSGNCTGVLGCNDFFDIDLEAGDTLSLSFCSDGGTASFDTDISVRTGPELEEVEVCTFYDCGAQAESEFFASDTATYRVRIGNVMGALGGTYTLAYSAPLGRLIVPSSCGNGSLDAGEECDDGNSVDGDCCSRRCTYEALESACTDDGNDCTADLCDGAGTCTHDNRPAGFACYDGEGFFCTADTCDGAGVCTHVEIPGCDMVPECQAPQPAGPVTYPHPAKAVQMQLSLVQAFVGCNSPQGNVPNATTETGTVPTCFPAETFDEDDANPPSGWHWGPYAKGSVVFKGMCKGPGDALIKLSMIGIVDGNGAKVTADGTFAIAPRLTLMDPVGGEMTTIDLPLSFAFHVVGGSAKVKTSLNAMLMDQPLPPLPRGVTFTFGPSMSLDAGVIDIRDSNGNSFARPGIYLP